MQPELDILKDKISILTKALESLKRGCSLSRGCMRAIGQECTCGAKNDNKKINDILESIK